MKDERKTPGWMVGRLCFRDLVIGSGLSADAVIEDLRT